MIGPHCTRSPLVLPPSHMGSPPHIMRSPPLALECGPPLLVTSSGHHWQPAETCSLEDPHQYGHLVATKADTVGKWAVRILLECFLVSECRFATSYISTQRNSSLVEKFVEQFPGMAFHVVLADFSLPSRLSEHRDVLSLPHQQVQTFLCCFWIYL